jgi:hypothetical protein
MGGMLFLAYRYVNGNMGMVAGDKTIVVDRAVLLNYMQYQSQAFNREYFSAQLDAMSPEERQRLIDNLVREEVLYREALALHLDETDYVMRRRLVQKMEFLNQGFIASGGHMTESEITAYFLEHRDEYYVQPAITFTHVFFGFERHGREHALQLARKTLALLNDRRVDYADAIHYGDRFLYHANYVDRTLDYVASHFGKPAADAIFSLDQNENQWHGPYESAYGMHLVLLAGKSPGHYPELREIIDQVRADAEQDLISRKSEEIINDLIKGYRVQVRLDAGK